ncbi:MAG: hypothetical protein J4F37_13700 [Acidobacteria bacterium]|nr:hypothetical protein [Acidobacteriota bacterium]
MRFATSKPHGLPVDATVVLAIVLVACADGAIGPENPNRPPIAVSELPAQRLAADGSVKLDASVYFNDPDGDALTYSALAHDSSIVRAFVFGPEVSLFGKNRGRPWVATTRVTIAASDPDGLSTEQDMRVMVEAGDVGFRDEFDSQPLSRWRLTGALAEVEDGTLLLTSSHGSVGKAKRELNANMFDWELRTRLARSQDSMRIRIVASTGQPVVQAIALDIGPGVLVEGNATNYRVLFLHREGGWVVAGAGSHPAFATLGEVLELGLYLRNGRVGVTLDGQPIRSEASVDHGVAGVELWVLPMDSASERKALFEWVEVSGTVP